VIGTRSILVVRAVAGLLCASILFSMAACSPQSAAPAAPDPSTVLQAIPAADATQYKRVRDMKGWRNPYLIVRADGVAILDASANAEVRLKTDELLGALARLPASDWPYGRVVAAAEDGGAAKQEAVAIRRNKGIVGGMLNGAHVVVKWVPAS
jgi:hypothetical protein